MKRGLIFAACAAAAVLMGTGCSRNSGPDPADANLAPVDQNVAPAASTEPVESYQTPPPAPEQLAEAPQPPPPLPQYQQPPCPGPNYIWTPGYWSYEETGYYWVPGAWVLAPYVDALWTPPYWAYADGFYHWQGGYWGRYIGFYGGIDYGFGYTGLGFDGGYWNDGTFMYNRAVTNVNTRIVRNVYSHPVHNYTPFNHVSYNGGRGGIDRRPTAPEMAVEHETHMPPVAAQTQFARQAAMTRSQFAGENRGRPKVAAETRPLATQYRAPAPPPRAWQRLNERAAATPNAANRTAPAANRPEPTANRTRPAVPAQGEASRMVRGQTQPRIAARAPEQARQPMQRFAQPRPEAAAHAAPPARFAAPQHAAVRPQPRPAAPREARPAGAPAARFAPRPQAHAAPPAFHMAPQSRPAQPAARFAPRPQAHAAPPAFHMAPQSRPAPPAARFAAPHGGPPPQAHAGPSEPRPGPAPGGHKR